MKKVLLGLLFTAFGFAATAQQLSPVKGEPGFNSGPMPVLTKKNVNALSKRHDSVSLWYNFIDSMRSLTGMANTGYYWPIFPDSLGKIVTTDQTTGNFTSYYIGTHAMGQIFDPNSNFILDKWPADSGYTLDSIAVQMRYDYRVPGSVDTLIFQFFTDANKSINIAKWTGGPRIGQKTAWVDYDPATRLGKNAVKEVRYLLSENDTIGGAGHILNIEVPGGIKVARNGIVAFVATYRPGYSYNLGDTVDQGVDPATFGPLLVPAKQLNSLRFFTLNDRTLENSASYNIDLRLVKGVRYDDTSWAGWKNRYIPGNAWNDYNEYLRSWFNISYALPHEKPTGVNELNAQGYALGNIFPNPAEGNATLEFALPKTENVKVQVYNVVGQLVNTVANGTYASGKHTVNINAEGMKPGVYFYTIQAGNFTQTKRFSVVK